MEVLRNQLVIFIAIFTLISCHGKMEQTVKAQGLVDGDVITIKSKAAGTLIKIDLKEGQKVKKGALVAEVDSAKIKNKFLELLLSEEELLIIGAKVDQKIKLTKQNIKYLKDQVGRFERLSKKEAIPGEKLEQMRLKLEEALNREDELNKELKKLKIQKKKLLNKKEYIQLVMKDHLIKAPVEGVVIERFATEGENLFLGTPIAEILDLNSLFVEVYLEEEEIAPLKLGKEVNIKIDGRAEKLIGQISFFGKKAEFSPKYIITEKERKSLLYRVKIKVLEKDLSLLKLGMIVTVLILKDDQSK